MKENYTKELRRILALAIVASNAAGCAAASHVLPATQGSEAQPSADSNLRINPELLSAAAAPSRPVITEFALPHGHTTRNNLTVGSDGRVWFGDNMGNGVGAMTPAGQFNFYPVPKGYANPTQIAVGNNNDLWVSAQNVLSSTCMGSCPAGPVVVGASAIEIKVSGIYPSMPGHQYNVLGGFSDMENINGNVLTVIPNTPAGTGEIDKVVAKTGYPRFSLGARHPVSVTGIPGGYLAVDAQNNDLVKLNDNGAVTSVIGFFSTPNGSPENVVVDSTGANYWVTQYNANKIAKVSAATGIVTEYQVPTPNSGPLGIAAGADGNMYFTERWAGKVARISPTGIITEYPVTSAAPANIVKGPNRTLYFIDWGPYPKIGKIQL